MKKNMWWFLIVIIVIGILVFITINKKDEPANGDVVGTEQENMQNTTDGVKITITKEGSGDVAKSGDTVAMNYTGKLADGTVFDSNVDPKFNHVEPFVFTIDGGMVIKGWDIGVLGMKVGEKRMLEIAPEFAYGESGIGPIPPNATLSFEVELVAIKK
ncbi:MAG: FKBP-type peptidyl-prolyl cis-trans isomerase [Candidatus Paceibacterota bacterium]|jgi:FKBP-type peptidyl-prolyl cis-trans isomerase